MSKKSAAGKAKKQVRGKVLDVLRELLADGRSEEILALVASLVDRNKELELLLAKMRESKHRGERVSKEQLDLFLDKLREQRGGEQAEGEPAPDPLALADRSLEETAEANGGRPEHLAPPKQPPVRRPPPPGARRVNNPLSVPTADRPCPVCGAMRECVTHETTEVIDLIPAEVIVRLDVREVLACGKCDAEVVRAPMGDKVVAGGAYGSGLVAHLIVSKYWDGLPLHRQGEQLERLGLSMPSSSMSDQIMWGTDLLRPIWNQLKLGTLLAGVMHLDGTSLPVQDKEGGKGLVTGVLWGYVGDEATAVYLYTSTGKRFGQLPGEVGPLQFLSKRKGPVVADASNLFDPTYASGERIELGCNMHGRRYFVAALEAGDTRAAVPIAAFRALYDIEARVKAADAQGRLAERQSRSKPVYEELIRWCQTYQPTEPPSSLLGKAIQYLLNHRLALTRFLDDGRFPIDNGIVERLHRRPAIGRRNYLFAGSHAAGERTAIAYSIVATCSLVGVNPEEYLADVLPMLARGRFTPDELVALLPAAWKAARSSVVPSPA